MSKTTFSGPVASQNGFIENSFTTAQRDAIVDPAVGLLIYNTDTNTYQVFNGGSWQPAFGPAPVVLPKPNVTTFTPTSGTTAGGTALTVSGSNFLFQGNPNVSTARLDFGGGITIDVTDIYVVSDTEFTCNTGVSYSGAVTNGVLRAYNANAQAGTASSTTFDYTSAPVATTYTVGVDYNFSATKVQCDAGGTTGYVYIVPADWTNPAVNDILTKTSGAPIQMVSMYGSTYIGTLTSGFTIQSPGTYRASVAYDPAGSQTYPYYDANSITI